MAGPRFQTLDQARDGREPSRSRSARPGQRRGSWDMPRSETFLLGSPVVRRLSNDARAGGRGATIIKRASYAGAIGAALLLAGSTPTVPAMGGGAAPRQTCAVHLESLCPGITPGEGRVRACIMSYMGDLWAACSTKRVGMTTKPFSNEGVGPDPRPPLRGGEASESRR
jgi:hypothetical protein